MRFVVIVARLLLGGLFLLFGLHGFFEFSFLPDPPAPTEEATAFWAGLERSQYFMPLLKGTEVVCGALLVLGLFVPLALVVLAPILVNIMGYHLYVDPTGMPMAIGLVVVALFLAIAYGRYFVGVLTPVAKPLSRKETDLVEF
jgi:uncharacterized membrane protein YphA (DoxX/SURF4 family)